MFPETRAAFIRLIAAIKDLRKSRSEYRRVIRETRMTDGQRKHFDEAFRHMDKAFEAIRKITL